MLMATSYSERVLSFLNQFASIYSFCLFVILFALALPARLFLLSIPFAVVALDALGRVNELKISAVSLPIMFFDVKMVIANPTVLVNAAGIRDDVETIISIAIGVLVFALIAWVFYKIRGYSFLEPLKLSRPRGEARTRPRSFVFNAVALMLVLIAAQTSLARYGRFVHANLHTKETKLWQELWLPSSQVSLSRKLGVLEYVAFSSFAMADETDIALGHG
ncbi:MAG TPA: hypothetical protein VFU31_21905, partial [Candidatus Binatia bacterium]|nr:hypothetical protein [Candidatus Binatia bacterium]